MGPVAVGLIAVAAIAVGAAVALLGLESSAPILVAVAILAAGYLIVRAQRTARRISRKLNQLATRQADQDKDIKRVLSRTERLGRLATANELRLTGKQLQEQSTQDFRQLEALLNLHAITPVGFALPPTRGWSASPDLLLLLTSLVATKRPTTVIDIGSGNSTLWLSLALRTYAVPGRVIALDHDDAYARSTRALLELHGLGEYAEVRHAPLVDTKVDHEIWPWYDLTALADVPECDLVVVDGPPGTGHRHARYPALPLLAPRLTDRAVVVLDDCDRADEQEIVQRWLAEFPSWTARRYRHEKITTVFTRQQPDPEGVGG
jgi:predicted O-methyltransferase YrrM